MKTFPLALTFALLLGSAPAQIELVRDIVPGSSSFNPFAFNELHGSMYFLANPGGQNELWKSDGTSFGTLRVTGLADGTLSREMTKVGNLLFFTIHDGLGTQLWVFDGTPLGLRKVHEVSGILRELTAWRGELAFVEVGLVSRTTVAISDGTPEGTRSVWDPPVLFPNVRELTPYRHLLLFVSDYQVDDDVFRSIIALDGDTGAALPLVGGIEDPRPEHLTVFDGRVFCSALGEDRKRELWVTEGATLQLFRDFGVQIPGSRPREITVVGDRLFGWADRVETDGQGNVTFANTDLFASDGTPGGTNWVTRGLEGGFQAGAGTSVGSLYLFTMAGRDPMTGELIGTEPWVSDGTPEGTRPLADINPFGSSGARRFFPIGSRTWFVASDGEHGLELWSAKAHDVGGLRVTTHAEMVQDLYQISPSSDPEGFFFYDGKIYFSARAQGIGRELHRLDPEAISVRVGQGWSRDGGEPVGLYASDLEPGTTAEVSSDAIPSGSVVALFLGKKADSPTEILPGVAPLIDATAAVHLVAVQADKVEVQFPVLAELPAIEAVFQAVVVDASRVELIMLTNPVLVYTERY